MLVGTDPIEFAIATNFVAETGFTNLQFIGLSALSHEVGDRMFETMVTSIQTDEARHAQIGHPVLATLIRHDPERAQYLVDKWFWRTWSFFALITGFSMDYLTPLAHRRSSFKEFMEEWIIDQFQRTLTAFGLKRPWYWDGFIEELDIYHHMLYASAYTYRSTVWFDFALPGPEERAWLRAKYPRTWNLLEPVWERIVERWRKSGPPLVRDEIYRISGEALRNAFRGEARRIELDLRYGVRWFELRVRHDGKGIDSRLLQEDALS
jgi:toluene monooxygenase system protein A